MAVSLLSSPMWLMLLASGLIGVVVGSFLNVVIYRVPRMLEAQWRNECAELSDSSIAAVDATYNLVVPGSACPECGRKIRPWENIPVISFLWLRGRCPGCKTRISLRYPVVEISGAAAALLCAWRFGPTLPFFGALFFMWTLIAASLIDLEHLMLPDMLTLPLLWLGLLFNVGHTFVSLGDAVIGAVVGYLALWSVYHLFRLLTGKEGLGRGDFKLLAALGAWLGWSMLPLVIFVAAISGILGGGGWLLYRRHGVARPIPFGPFLAFGGVIGLFIGPLLVRTYLTWVHGIA